MPLLQTDRAEEFTRLLRERVSEEVFDHSISAAEFMLTYADEAGITHKQAVIAGLLHDLSKSMKGPELLEAAEEYGIAVNETQRAKPKLLHGAVAACECRRLRLIDDDDVYEAIYWHTTGRPGLCNLGLALYFADFAESLRTIPEAAQARRLLESAGFHAALRFVSKKKLEHVQAKGYFDPMTKAFDAWLETELS